MKNYFLLFLLVITMASCRHAWNESNDKTFHNACLDEAKSWTGTQVKAETYCNCVIVKVKEKYPDEDEAMKNIGTLYADKDLQACKDSVMKK